MARAGGGARPSRGDEITSECHSPSSRWRHERARSVCRQGWSRPWWCPVCNGAAHRTRRPGRPRLYCSNACRQRAYRWRRDHHARTVATPAEPVPSAFVAFGRFHAVRTPRDFVTQSHDRRSRRPTVCGVLAAPSRGHIGRRTHYDFLFISSRSCRSLRRPRHPTDRPTGNRQSATATPVAVGALDTRRLRDLRPTPHDAHLGNEAHIAVR